MEWLSKIYWKLYYWFHGPPTKANIQARLKTLEDEEQKLDANNKWQGNVETFDKKKPPEKETEACDCWVTFRLKEVGCYTTTKRACRNVGQPGSELVGHIEAVGFCKSRN